MKTEHTFIAHPTTTDQINALKAVVKAFNVKFEVKKQLIKDDKSTILNNIKKGLKEVSLMQKGELKATSLNDFLSEL